MVDRRDLEGALLRATDWVQAEYAYIEDIAVGMGCEKRLESGPGVAFRLEGKVICRAHPKRDHLAVGLPDRMRSDVQALTLVLRAQKGLAWFNYAPGVADHDTIERLLGISADPARSTTRSPRSDVRDNNRVPPDDEADLLLILRVLRAFQHHETATGLPLRSVKPLRETLFFRWDGPRLPPGGKYSPLIPHSPAARDQYAAHVSLCSGAFVLAQAGLLDGHRATTHWMHAAELATRYPLVQVDPTVLYVHDDVWTSAGSAAALDMCLELVRNDYGTAIANEVARRIVTPPHRNGGQAQYIRPRPTPTRAPLSDTLDWARRNVDTVTVPAIAARAGTSTRTLHRTMTRLTGGSPQEWLLRERLQSAQELLEATALTIDAIAARTGLGSAANLRSHFANTFGVSPSEYRNTFSTNENTARLSAAAGA